MNDFLPLFPLELVVFPGEDLHLHIFEPRYKQLIKDCEEGDLTFGIPVYLNKKLMNIGTELTLVSVEKKYLNGELDIRTRGLNIFNVKAFYPIAPRKLYGAADIERLSFATDEDLLKNEKILDLTRELFQLLNITKTLPEDANNFLTYDIAHHIGLTLAQEYQLLQMLDASERQAFILFHMEGLLPMVREMENLKVKAQLNGHFKHLNPPTL